MKRMWSDEAIKAESSATVKEMVEGGTLDNAKPIYIHPILLAKANVINVAIMIFNNDATPFTTYDEIKAFVKKIAVDIDDIARFPAMGAYYTDEIKYPSHIFSTKGGALSIYVTGSNGVNAGLTIDSLTDVQVFDGVNRLN